MGIAIGEGPSDPLGCPCPVTALCAAPDRAACLRRVLRLLDGPRRPAQYADAPRGLGGHMDALLVMIGNWRTTLFGLLTAVVIYEAGIGNKMPATKQEWWTFALGVLALALGVVS